MPVGRMATIFTKQIRRDVEPNLLFRSGYNDKATACFLLVNIPYSMNVVN